MSGTGPAKSHSIQVYKYDDSFTGLSSVKPKRFLTAFTDKTTYLVKANGKSMDDKGRTISPFVGNHKHYLRFGNAGNDFDKFTIAFPEKLSNDADAFEYVTPHYEKRVAMYFDPNVGSRQANNTLVTTPRDSWTMGMNVHYNESETREAQFVVIKRGGASSLSITGKSCIVNCVLPPVPVIPLEEVTNLWSDPKTWKNLPNRIPLEGEDVIVPTDYNVIYDIGISPLFKSLEINGRVTFLPG